MRNVAYPWMFVNGLVHLLPQVHLIKQIDRQHRVHVWGPGQIAGLNCAPVCVQNDLDQFLLQVTSLQPSIGITCLVWITLNWYHYFFTLVN